MRIENFRNNINTKFSELNDIFNNFELKWSTLTCQFQDVVMRRYNSETLFSFKP